MTARAHAQEAFLDDAAYQRGGPCRPSRHQPRARPPGTQRDKGRPDEMNSRTVSAELGLRLVVPQQTIVPLVASLYYSSDDPYAIPIPFHVGLDEPVDC